MVTLFQKRWVPHKNIFIDETWIVTKASKKDYRGKLKTVLKRLGKAVIRMNYKKAFYAKKSRLVGAQNQTETPCDL